MEERMFKSASINDLLEAVPDIDPEDFYELPEDADFEVNALREEVNEDWII